MARECNPKRRPSHASCHIKSINENYLRGNRMKLKPLTLIFCLIALSGCNKSGPHEVANGEGTCVDVVSYDGDTGQNIVISRVNGNGYMIYSGHLFKSDRCSDTGGAKQ
jgi:hypothetical protein